ncbi:MAG: sigma-70 family RNA polymerase sigma factor [Clostridiales bacterium]|nr:sigma-70 family RNA polymerase sigma factor [Clostridiales bacterium]
MPVDVSKVSDFDLIQMCINEDMNYFSELMRRYKNLVFSVILRMVNDKEEANDLAQEVFIKVYKNLHKYYPEFKFSTWIIRITTNHVIDFRRKKKQESVPIEDVEYELSSEESPEAQYIRKERDHSINSLLEALPDMYKIPIVLYHKEGLSYQEISDIIKEPLSKVKNRIFRARKMLKESIINTGVGEYYGV